MRAILVGAVESSRIALRCLAAADDWELAGVVTLPESLAARHSDFADLRPDAEAAGCPVIEAANGNAPEILERIAELRPDYLFVIGWSQLCGDDMRALAPGGVVGYHPAPLPRLRGRGVIPWTILLNESITAGTLFRIDGGTDTGPILAQRFFHVAPDEYAATLYARHMEALAEMLPDALHRIATGNAEGIEQEERYATWAARRRPDDAEVCWRDEASEIWRLVRACGDPYPGARTKVGAEPLIIVHADPVPLDHHRAALVGQVIGRDDDSFTVRCGDGRGLRVSGWRWDRPGAPPLHARLGERA